MALFPAPIVARRFDDLLARAFHRLKNLRRSAMDKLCPKFDRDFYPGDVLGEDPSANAIASLENSDAQAGAREFDRAAESSRSGANDQRCFGHAFTMQDLGREVKLGCLPGIRT